MSQPLFIGGLLKYFDPVASRRSDTTHAYTCASGLVCSMLISIVLTHSTYNETILSGMKVRVACSSILYRKVCTYVYVWLIQWYFGIYISRQLADVGL